MSLASIAKANLLHPKDFVRLYRNHLSDFSTWREREHADKWLIFPENIGAHLAIDEVEVSGGELYTIVTNQSRHGKKGCLVAIVAGTSVQTVAGAICKIPLKHRKIVKTLTRDMADTMSQIAADSFPNAIQIDDRFHVQRLVSDALQEERVEARRIAIKEHNLKVAEARKRGGHYWPPRFENGDTAKELLARSRYLLYKPSGRWSDGQRKRSIILFREYPKLKEAYNLTMQFRGIYEHGKSRRDGKNRLHRWYGSVMKKLNDHPDFEGPLETIQLSEDTILNYFVDRQTNAGAESFNSKIKNFRALQRGVRDVTFFLYRLSKLYG